MKTYIFTEFINLQSRRFVIMLLLGCSLFTLYRIAEKYVFQRISIVLLKSVLEIIFFIASSLFTAGIVDNCCGAVFKPYMIAAFVLGLPVSFLIVKKEKIT